MSASLSLAKRYVRFRDEIFGGLGEAVASWGEPMPELQLQSLWFSGEFGTEFNGEDGERILVRDFGEWNSGAGPDFTRCTVLVNGEQRTGDIELDPEVRDWERHQHGANPDFNNVVLHLFIDAPIEARAYTRTANHRMVTQVRLTPAMLGASFSPPQKVPAARLGRCALPLTKMAPAAVRSLIEAAAQHRLERKGRRLHLCAAVHGREQAVYQGLAQTLGYRQNQRSFTLIAQRLPLRQLLSLEPVQREALLFGLASFLDSVSFDEAQFSTRTYLGKLWKHWWKTRSTYTRWADEGRSLKWNLKAVRPGNHPQRRLGALAAMLEKWGKIMAPLKRAESWNRKTWEKHVSNLSHEFWDTHYTLTALPSPRPIALVGETRVQEMLANVVYPLLVPEKPQLWAEFKELPAALDNQKVRRAVLRLFGEDERGKNFQQKLHQQQGLLQIYEDFCLEDDSSCADCPFPERLTQWG